MGKKEGKPVIKGTWEIIKESVKDKSKPKKKAAKKK